MAKTSETIHDDIKQRFEKRMNDSFEDNSMMDLYTMAISDEFSKIYEEIENSKTPHVWTCLEGAQLDKAGAGLNCPREVGESDATYKYRIMNWNLSNEAGNDTAIKTALLNPVYASNIEYIPFTDGCGTATCYVLPKHYTREYIENALKEAADIIARKGNSSTYVKYIVPRVLGVRLQALLQAKEDADVDLLKERIESKVANYINAIPPKSYLDVGAIDRLAYDEDEVVSFSLVGLSIDDEYTTQRSVLQGIDTKMLFDEIDWGEI